MAKYSFEFKKEIYLVKEDLVLWQRIMVFRIKHKFTDG